MKHRTEHRRINQILNRIHTDESLNQFLSNGQQSTIGISPYIYNSTGIMSVSKHDIKCHRKGRNSVRLKDRGLLYPKIRNITSCLKRLRIYKAIDGLQCILKQQRHFRYQPFPGGKVPMEMVWYLMIRPFKVTITGRLAGSLPFACQLVTFVEHFLI